MRLSRRSVLRRALVGGLSLACTSALPACRREVEVEPVVEQVVTDEVTEVVQEPMVVEPTPTMVMPIPSPTPSPAPPATVVLDVMGYGWTRLGQQMAPAFRELYPHIALEWRATADWSTYPARVAAAHAAGTLGDVVEAPPGPLLAAWADERLLEPLEPLLEAEGIDTGGIFRGLLHGCRRVGRLMGMPIWGNGGETVLLYHREAFADQGLDEPNEDWTLDDLAEAATALHSPARHGYALRLDLPGAYPLLRLFGASLLSLDGMRCALADEGALDLLRWAYEQGEPPRAPLTAFAEGRAAMVRHGPRLLLTLQHAGAEGELVSGVAFPRHPQTKRRGARATGMAYCLRRGTAVGHEAVHWLEYMASHELGVQLLLGGHADPGCRGTAWRDPRVAKVTPIYGLTVDLAEAARVERLPWNLRLNECFEVWNRHVLAMLSRRIDPGQTLERICSQVDAVLARPKLRLLDAGAAAPGPQDN